MNRSCRLLIAFFIAALSAAFAAASGSVEDYAQELFPAEEGVSRYAYEITSIFGLPITNSMLTTWVIALALIALVRFGVGRPGLVPGRGQAIFESLIEGMKELLTPVIGEKMVKPVFPFLLGLFTFILINNWSGLLPGVGVFGYYNEKGTLLYWLRPANTDLNTTLGLALLSMALWLYFVIRYAGAGALFFDLFGNKADKRETPIIIYYLLIPVFLLVGFIEMISIAFRPVSLSFRLFGNMFGGENLLISMTNFASYIVPIPFYLFETLVGVIQAGIFTLLVAIYIGLICNHEGGDHAH